MREDDGASPEDGCVAVILLLLAILTIGLCAFVIFDG